MHNTSSQQLTKANFDAFAQLFEILQRCKKPIKYLKFIANFQHKYGKCSTKQDNDAQWGHEYGKDCSVRTIRRYNKIFIEAGLIEARRTGRALVRRLTSKGFAFLSYVKSLFNRDKKNVSDQMSDQRPSTIYINRKKPTSSNFFHSGKRNMTKQYQKPSEPSPIEALKQANEAKRKEEHTQKLIKEKDVGTSFAPNGLIQRLLGGLKGQK